jgi:ankyrin repeat protein
VVELLLLSGADVHASSHRGDTPLHYAARHKDDVESVKVLLRAGARVDCRNSLGNTPFAGAAIMNSFAVGRYLLKCGADRHTTNKYGDTPLRETIHHNCHGFLQMLLEDDTNFEDVNKHGSSLLHAVALEGDLKTLQILSKASLGALDIQRTNNRGETAVDICLKRIGVTEEFRNAFLQLVETLPSQNLDQWAETSSGM